MNGDGSPPEIGVVEWFRTGEYERVDRVLDLISKLGTKRLRTAVSWEEYHTDAGASWYAWLLPHLAESVDLLPYFTYTPPVIGSEDGQAALPREPRAYADFLDLVLDRHGSCFEWVELWTEPIDLQSWILRPDGYWADFRETIATVAHRAHDRGRKAVLGGVGLTRPDWLSLLARSGTLEHIDALGLHGVSEAGEGDRADWGATVAAVREVLRSHDLEAAVWITHAGHSTSRNDEFAQLSACADLLQAPVERAYWYAVQDGDSAPGHHDVSRAHERRKYTGLYRWDGREKLLARVWSQEGLAGVAEMARLGRTPDQEERVPARRQGRGAGDPVSNWNGTPGKLHPNGHAFTNGRRGTANSYTLVTGGAGFIGTNLSDRLLSSGHSVRILDSLSRPGVENNLRWLRRRHGDRLQLQLEDIRDRWAVSRAVQDADRIFHFAGQVAVTSSVEHPREDFDVNAGGTLNVLEALRELDEPPPLLFTSTNKVYGSLDDIRLRRERERYVPVDEADRGGVGSDRPLDFESPYGCSKGSADMYVLDYARMYGLPTVVFRMSCIYGAHQRGTEDQGWVAHFMMRALRDESITIFGDGRQVRDVLYVEDLVDAMIAAVDSIARTGGRAFNIGGGPARAVSLLQVLDLIRKLNGVLPDLTFEEWRPSDQKYYVSDTTLFSDVTGWQPKIDVEEGLRRLREWLLVESPVDHLSLTV